MREKSDLPWLKLFPSDHIAATRDLTLAERGALFDLMCFAWMHGKLPRDPRRLAALVGTSSPEFKKIWPAIRPHFKSSKGGWIHPALEELRTQGLTQKAAAKEKAQTAAMARWRNAGANKPSSGPRPVSEILSGSAQRSRL